MTVRSPRPSRGSASPGNKPTDTAATDSTPNPASPSAPRSAPAQRAGESPVPTSTVGPAPFGQPTLEEVAALAGVSRATVSRVINDSPRVSPEAREAVRKAIVEVGYVPNRAARSLVTRRTDSIALVVSEPETRVFSDPFFGRIVRAISAGLDETQLQLVLLMTQTGQEHARLSQYARGHVDGALLISAHGDDTLPAMLAESGLPTVLMGRSTSVPSLSYVDADNHGGARLAVDHLHAIGRRRIAHISGPLDMSAGQDRLAGYREALDAHQLTYHESLVAPGYFTEEGGEEAMRALLDRAPDLDAVFCASDLMAAGALRALHAAHKAIPGDVAVIGFDDAVTARHTNPPLTTISQPVEEMSQQMIALLMAKLAGSSNTESIVLQTQLVRRGSA